MKANELMLGDWVKFPIGNEKIIDLPYIDGKGVCASFSASATLFPVKVEELKPIPLTPDILQKIGFRKILDDRDVYYFSTDYFEILIDEYSDSIWRVKYVNLEVNMFIRRELIGFVHELQHVFRLWGIEIDIKL